MTDHSCVSVFPLKKGSQASLVAMPTPVVTMELFSSLSCFLLVIFSCMLCALDTTFGQQTCVDNHGIHAIRTINDTFLDIIVMFFLNLGYDDISLCCICSC